MAYVPERGDVVWLEFNPQAGHEQGGRRPALVLSPKAYLVLSPKAYNEKVGLFICCPITSKIKGFPYEVPLPVDFDVTGVILADQVKSLDWQGRKAQLIARVPNAVIKDVLAKLNTLLD